MRTVFEITRTRAGALHFVATGSSEGVNKERMVLWLITANVTAASF